MTMWIYRQGVKTDHLASDAVQSYPHPTASQRVRVGHPSGFVDKNEVVEVARVVASDHLGAMGSSS